MRGKTPEADEDTCVECGEVYAEHSLDGMGECPSCVDLLTKASE